jgi:hypothetical protein
MRLKTDKTGDPPSTAWIGAALLRLAVDGASLFLFFFLLACISVCLGLPHWGYFAINAVVSLLLLPGWLLARRWPSSRPGCVCRFYHASLISFVLYGAAAFGLHVAPRIVPDILLALRGVDSGNRGGEPAGLPVWQRPRLVSLAGNPLVRRRSRSFWRLFAAHTDILCPTISASYAATAGSGV